MKITSRRLHAIVPFRLFALDRLLPETFKSHRSRRFSTPFPSPIPYRLYRRHRYHHRYCYTTTAYAITTAAPH